VAVAISTDLRDDTHESIRAFLRRLRAPGTFRYLTGPLPEMKRLWQSFQILFLLRVGRRRHAPRERRGELSNESTRHV
jgi:cytochrome oxidase Cu insertion factor (SCO1/SenC/PrrC family)